MVVVGAPGRPIVHQDCGRQTVAAKRAGQHAAHGRRGAHRRKLKHEREARMVVEHGERMAAAAAEQGEVALEVPSATVRWAPHVRNAGTGVVRARRRGRAAPRGAECQSRCSAPAPDRLGT